MEDRAEVRRTTVLQVRNIAAEPETREELIRICAGSAAELNLAGSLLRRFPNWPLRRPSHGFGTRARWPARCSTLLTGFRPHGAVARCAPKNRTPLARSGTTTRRRAQDALSIARMHGFTAEAADLLIWIDQL